MLGNLHVRFGGGGEETCGRATRLAPTLQRMSTYGELDPWLKTLPDGPVSGGRVYCAVTPHTEAAYSKLAAQRKVRTNLIYPVPTEEPAVSRYRLLDNRHLRDLA
jgi:hypothetical protein